jgi:hypothetical protein
MGADPMPKIIRDNSLTLALLALFLFSIAGHLIAGWKVENQTLAEHGQGAVTLGAYLTDPSFLATVFENWESEFLQMGTYVVLTAYLFQRGSSESRDPDQPPREGEIPERPIGRWFYAHSLGLVMAGLFVASFLLHWRFSAAAAAEEAQLHGQTPKDSISYLLDPQLWFESFQNWQSEFLSTALLVLLSVVLREKNSPESKEVEAPNAATGQ